ncbi:hypothetical protein [Flavobacterium subsaxonicum]|uniref:Lipoprotein n=1 Tax=Flavobacterium subsaxonicum WB 4.1-42 = DSM 21790 TaxID=1121898 RepID=A0A0A2MJ33_9FLAO|nr:hypothetical protein [Flavobacterium subsaxonicum]KGO92622.1 hypothetical protein Q766_10865 [Flavobacterium subsaxonicum WB 4.1-42 = DSM 21790]
MKKFNLLLILLLLALACKSKNTGGSNCQAVIKILKSKEFDNFYRLCERPEKEIYIYDSTNKFGECKKIPIACDKTLNVIKTDFEINLNSTSDEKNNKVVLYNFEKNKINFKFYFINTRSNSTLVVTYDSNTNEIINTERGAF